MIKLIPKKEKLPKATSRDCEPTASAQEQPARAQEQPTSAQENASTQEHPAGTGGRTDPSFQVSSWRPSSLPSGQTKLLAGDRRGSRSQASSPLPGLHASKLRSFGTTRFRSQVVRRRQLSDPLIPIASFQVSGGQPSFLRVRRSKSPLGGTKFPRGQIRVSCGSGSFLADGAKFPVPSFV